MLHLPNRPESALSASHIMERQEHTIVNTDYIHV